MINNYGIGDINMSKKMKITILIVFLIVLSAGGFYYINNDINYKNTLASANNAYQHDEFDKALKLYGETKKYKKDASIENKIKLCKSSKQSKAIYDNAIKQMNNKEYVTSMSNFAKVDKNDTNRYKDSQDKLAQCKKIYIEENIKIANDDFNNHQYTEANELLNKIFAVDSSNVDGLKLKNQIAAAIKHQNDDAAAAKVAAEKAEQAKTAAASSKTTQSAPAGNKLTDAQREKVNKAIERTRQVQSKIKKR